MSDDLAVTLSRREFLAAACRWLGIVFLAGAAAVRRSRGQASACDTCPARGECRHKTAKADFEDSPCPRRTP